MALVSLNTTGCVAVLAGGAAAGGTAYVMGDLEAQVDASPRALQSAIVGAGKDLKLNYISGSGDELAGKYVFRNAADDKITIRYEVITNKTSELSIRVGTFGDKAMSLRLHDTILKRL